MEIAENITPKTQKKTSKKIPNFLIYEVLDGQALYYKGYQAVVKGQKTLEEIMGSSTLQALLVFFFNELLIKGLNTEKYYIFLSEAGIHLSHKDNLSNDIAVYESSLLTPDKINDQYATVPPKLVIEIDTKAALNNSNDMLYVQRKTQKLLDFGTEKVIWVFTDTQKVMSATLENNWEICNWDKEIALIENLSINIAQYLSKKGIEIPKEL